MNIRQRARYFKENNRNVFRNTRKKNNKSLIRQLFEGSLLTLSGIYLLAFLNWLPEKFDLEKILVDSWNSFTLGSYHLFESLLGLGGVLLTLILIVIGIICLLSGFLRLIRFCFLLNRYINKRTRPKIRLRGK